MVLLLVMDVWAYFSINKLSNGVNMIEENLLQLDLLSRLQLIVEKMLMQPHDYSIHGDPAEKMTFNTRYALIEKMFAGIEKTNLTEEEKNILVETRAISSEVKEKALEVLNLESSTIKNMLSLQPMMKQIDALAENLVKKIEILNQNAYASTIKAIFQAKTSTHGTGKVLFYCTALIFVNALAVGLFILSIVKPIKLLQEGAELVSHGKLDHRVDVRSHDELRDLADAFNKMVGNLEKSLIDIEGEKDKLESVLLDIGDGVMVGDAKYNLLFMNPIAEKIIGKRCEDLLGKEFFGCHKEGDKVMKTIENDQLPVTTKISYNHKILYIKATSIKTVDGKTLGYTMIVRDVTEQERQVKEKLEVL